MQDAIDHCRDLIAFWGDDFETLVERMDAAGFTCGETLRAIDVTSTECAPLA